MTLSCPSSTSSKLEVKYCRNCDRYDVGVDSSRTGSHLLAIDWHRDLWPWMTLNTPSPRSSKLQVTHFKNGDRYDVAVNRRRMGSRPWAID